MGLKAITIKGFAPAIRASVLLCVLAMVFLAPPAMAAQDADMPAADSPDAAGLPSAPAVAEPPMATSC